jgi:ribosomal protein S18 acetylase RimI-like enzyme
LCPGSPGKRATSAAWRWRRSGRGRGIARALLHAAEDELRSLGCSRVTLDTTAPLRRAISFYEGHGYRMSGRSGDFFGMPLHEYAKDLAETAGGAE